MPLEQRPAEQLVRREEPERRVGRGEAVPVDGADCGARRPPCPTTLPITMSARCSVAVAYRRWSASGARPVVMVGEEHELALAPRRGPRCGAAPASPSSRMWSARTPGCSRRERVEPLARSVARAVVDEDDLALAGGHRLMAQRGDQRLDQPARLEDRDDDADLWHPGLLAPRV